MLSLPGNDSLKGKRRVKRRIADRVRHRFNAAIAEVASLEAHRRLVLGVAVVSNDPRHASSMLERVGAFVAGASEAVLVERSTELVHLGDELGAFDGEGWGGSDG